MTLQGLKAPRAAFEELAPSGRLRIAVNLDNAVLVQRDTSNDRLSGVVIDLAHELARVVDLPLDIKGYESAAKIVAATKQDVWDVSFFAVDPRRAEVVWYSPPYLVIEGSYMVPRDSPLNSVADVDAAGVRIAVGVGAAYDLYLTRTLKHAQLVRDQDSPAAIERFRTDRLEAVAGVRQPLLAYAKAHPELRVIDGSFTQIQQAAVLPRDRAAAQRFLTTFIESLKASGVYRGGIGARWTVRGRGGASA